MKPSDKLKWVRQTLQAYGKDADRYFLTAFVAGPYEPGTKGWYEVYDAADKKLRELARNV